MRDKSGAIALVTAPLALHNTPNIFVCLSCVRCGHAPRGADQTRTHDNVKESPRFRTGPTDSRDVMHELKYTVLLRSDLIDTAK